MTPRDAEPRTEAGKRLLLDLTRYAALVPGANAIHAAEIAAIEAEAATPADSLDVERLAAILDSHTDKDGHVLPPIIQDEAGRSWFMDAREFATVIAAEYRAEGSSKPPEPQS